MHGSSIAPDKKPSKLLVPIFRLISLFVGKLFFSVAFHRKGNIPSGLPSGFIVASNHQSFLDPFLISIPLKGTLRFLAWDEAFEWFFVGRLIGLLGAFPVSLKRGGTVRAIKQCLEILKRGESLVIFPEASREFADGKLLPFKTGAVRLAIESGSPILPVTIRGANRVWSRDHKFPRPGKIDVYYHPLLYPESEGREDNGSEAVFSLNERLRKIIDSV